MSADLLRRASSELRERISQANSVAGNNPSVKAVYLGVGCHLVMTRDFGSAIADWLDRLAVRAEEFVDLIPASALESVTESECLGYVEAVEAARLLLGLDA